MLSTLATASVLNLFLCVLTIILYYKSAFSYWKKRNIANPKPRLFFGNSQNPIARKSATFEHLKSIYDKMKAQKYDYCGIYVFSTPAYIPLNPEYVKHIMSKDFTHFVDRGMYYNERDDPLSAHLLSLEGQKWKNLRVKLTPTFTSGKMKIMFTILQDCGNQLLDAMEKLSRKPLDIKEICACYTTDIIGSCAFGLDCNSFAETESDFRKYGKKSFELSVQNVLRIIFCTVFPKAAKKIGVKLINPQVSDFFIGIIEATLKYRKEKAIVRNDFLQLLIDLKQAEELTLEEVAAQAFLFFLAGFETSSTTMSSCLYELARNEEIQNKVREEVVQAFFRNDGKLTYESLAEMKYLGQTIDGERLTNINNIILTELILETLRLYPSVPLIQRVCTKDYNIVGTDAILEKGTKVFLPVFALQRDPEFYPDPEKFDPDRFSDENKLGRHPFTYLPFGDGPRVCIGKNI